MGVEREWFSIKEVARKMGVGDGFVRRRVISGIIPAIDIGTPGRPTWRVSRDTMDEFAEKRRNISPASSCPPPP